MFPKNNAPSGRARKPIAKTPNPFIRETKLLSEGKNKGASLPTRRP